MALYIKFLWQNTKKEIFFSSFFCFFFFILSFFFFFSSYFHLLTCPFFHLSISCLFLSTLHLLQCICMFCHLVCSIVCRSPPPLLATGPVVFFPVFLRERKRKKEKKGKEVTEKTISDLLLCIFPDFFFFLGGHPHPRPLSNILFDFWNLLIDIFWSRFWFSLDISIITLVPYADTFVSFLIHLLLLTWP